jgi:hypothetical protein
MKSGLLTVTVEARTSYLASLQNKIQKDSAGIQYIA